MLKLALSTIALALAGCASTGAWRTLSIDSSSESAFQDSISSLNDGLSSKRQQYFALALIDIAVTGAEEAGVTEDGSPAYTDEDFRSAVDGLTYDGVIDLADEAGMPVRLQYYYSGGRVGPNQPFYDPTQGRPTFTAGGRPISDVRPYGRDWPTDADGNGNAVYGNR